MKKVYKRRIVWCKKESEWANEKKRFKKQVSASCKRLRFSAESMVSHLERNLLPIFLFCILFFFFAQIKRKKKFLNTDNFSLHLSLFFCCGDIFLSLSWGLQYFCFDVNVHYSFVCNIKVFGWFDFVVEDFVVTFIINFQVQGHLKSFSCFCLFGIYFV